MAERDDVVVAGGGPAGALAALILARQGWRVRVFERARFPRRKLCGDTLNPGAVAVLARHVDVQALRDMGRPLRGMRLSGPGGVDVSATYPRDMAGIAVTRRTFDAWLLGQAAQAGATIDEGVAVRGSHLVDGRVAGVEIDGPGSSRVVHASRLTIAADGRRSALAAALGASTTPDAPRRWAFGVYADGVAGLDVSRGEMHVRRSRYVGIAPLGGGLANVCVVVSRDEARALTGRDGPALLRDVAGADPWLGPRFASARATGEVASLGPMAVDVDLPKVPGLLLAGDAAGFIDPMTGDGLRLAFTGAELVASVAHEVLAGRCAAADAPARLAAARRGALSTKWRFNRTLRAAVDAPSALAVLTKLARAVPWAFGPVVSYAGDVSLARS